MPESRPLTLVSLPYDIRYLIYQHIFPRTQQIYLQALQDGSIKAVLSYGSNITTNIFLTCRAIYMEAAGFLYNNYLFNLIGTKQLCLSSHKGFLKTVRKHAREEVHVHAFSNGVHSDTMCISIHTGDRSAAILKDRRRGVEITLREVQREIRPERYSGPRTSNRVCIFLFGIVCSFLLSAVWSNPKWFESLLQLFQFAVQAVRA